MTEFDPIKAAREELLGLSEVLKAVSQFERRAEEAMSIAENELNMVRKLRGYAQKEIAELRDKLASMENPPDARS